MIIMEKGDANDRGEGTATEERTERITAEELQSLMAEGQVSNDVEGGYRKEEERKQTLSSNISDGRQKRHAGQPVQFVCSFFVITGVAVSWACAIQFRKSTLVIDPRHFYAPFAMVWFSTAFMCVCYPVFMLYVIFTNKSPRTEHADALKLFASQPERISLCLFLFKPLLFLTLWTIINYSYAVCLGLISASAAASIMSANTAVVCVLGWLLLKELFSALKLFAVLLAIAGVIIVSLDSKFAGSLSGIALAILSAVLAAVYKVLFKMLNGSASLGQVSLFMSVLGLLNIVLNLAPTSVLLHFDLDHIEWTHIPWLPLIGSGLLGLIFNFLVNFGIVLLDPLVISIGMLFGMPLSAFIDVLFRAMPISAPFLAGSALITISFAIIAFPVQMAMRRLCSSCNYLPNESSPLQQRTKTGQTATS